MKARKLNSKILFDRFGIEFSDDTYRFFFNELLNQNLTGSIPTIEEVIINWDDFVNSAKDGCGFDEYEFDNDLSIARKSVNILFNNKEINNFQEHSKFIDIVSLIDDKLNKIITAHNNG